jgi:DNA polymerase III subunit alpha
MNLQDWINLHKLKVEFESLKLLSIKDVGSFLVVSDKEKVFDDRLHLILDSNEQLYNVDYYLFEFGGKWYYTSSVKNIEFNLFQWIGKCNQEIDENFPYLGIHDGYELLNGSGLFEQWIKKAKFYGYKTLAICERNTLAGVLAFQIECKKNNIKAIIGEEIVVRRNNYQYDCKLYVLNEEGWLNLLSVHKVIKIESNDFINEETLFLYGKGLVLVLNPDVILSDEFVENCKKSFDKVFYQIDTVRWNDNERDKKYLLSIKSYLDDPKIEPILINDSYYLNKQDSHIKSTLNVLFGKTIQYKSDDQYFKNLDDNFLILSDLFNEDDRLQKLFTDSLNSCYWIEENSNYNVPLDKLHLPKFDLKSIPKKYGKIKTSEDLFWKLIEEGIEKKLGSLNDIYSERLEREAKVIIDFKLIDYFLIIWDIIRWCKENDIYVGLGRGSASGSLCVYLMDITKIDPIKYDLIFERFINEGRLGYMFKSIIFEGEDGEVKELWEDDIVKIKRDNLNLSIKAIEIIEGDILI